MPVYLLGPEIVFPPVTEAEHGLVAVGGDLSRDRLIHAYANGIFPWYSEGEPILWHSPHPRFVLTTDAFRVPRTIQRAMRRSDLSLTLDEAFEDVVEACATVPRPGQSGTWITTDMKRAYLHLHREGYAHSVEAWQGSTLVGGLYGVSLGAAYFGESMFARVDDASKVAFATFVSQLAAWGITLIDCQVETEHLARFGATSWHRTRYLKALKVALREPTKLGRWKFDPAAE